MPYKLQDGDDINSIDIWYIDDVGQTKRVKDAAYSNGYVTFTTNHFSYYTVTRLTPAERCERLGSHIEVQQVKAATCTEDGYNMTVCQRCGKAVEGKTEIIPKTGHNYADNEKKATCTDAGLLTRTCTNSGCGSVITKTIPALGHDKKPDTVNTVAATCNAAGKSVEACSRCDYTAEEPLAQLEHDYEKSTEKSVAVTCSAAGYDVYVCTLCGDEQRKNDTAPLGHSFVEKKDGWKWTDNTTAVVTLECENDTSHTKELTAVVTKNDDKSQNTSCLGSGSIVYEAAVSYNGKTYTDVNEITVEAPGHKPGTAWESSATQHYHLCTVCGEKQGAEAHAWNDGTVTKEPTCKDAGSKTVKCTVCSYEKTQSIPATGEHNYVNGVCTGCGNVQSDCRHLPINKSLVDVEALGLCDQAAFNRYSCDCGQVVEYEIIDYNCDFGDTTTEKIKDDYGFTTTIQSATCVDCGLQITLREGHTADAENCSVIYAVVYQFHKDGALVAEQEMYSYEEDHPGVYLVDAEVIEHEYLCGDITVEFKKCICGKYTTASIDSDCQWGWAVGGEYNTENYSHGMCNNCGATQDIEWVNKEIEGKPCNYEQTNNVRLAIGKYELYTYSYTTAYEGYYGMLSDYEMLGESCTDGVVIQTTCERCGKIEESFIRDHEPMQYRFIDLGDEHCSKSLIQYTCLCDEKFADCQLSNENGNGCYLDWAYDKETGEEFWMCYECGLKRYEKTTYGEKDEDCYCMADTVYTFKNAEDVTVATGNRRYETTNHDMKAEYRLVEGAESCEDGVIIRNYCADCTYDHSYEDTYHEQYLANTYDLSALGGCTKEIYLYRCACGQQSHFEYDQYCEQSYVDSNVENQEQWKCDICGMLETISYSYPETGDPCLNHSIRLYTYSMEGVDTTVRFTRDEYNENHDYVYEATLNPGATDCYGGWSAIGTCLVCGDVDEYRSSWHETLVLSMEQIDGGKMCGSVYLQTRGCPCGQNRYTNVEWDEENRCDFRPEQYNPETGYWTYKCVNCGSGYYQERTETPSADGSCRIDIHMVTRYCDKDGNALFETESNSWTYNHDYLAQFLNPDGTAWSGTDCAQGYRIKNVCTKCGAESSYPQVYTECETYYTSVEQAYDGTGLCGPVMLKHSRCACGKETRTEVVTDCQWSYQYDNANNRENWVCKTCGASYYNEYTREAVPGVSCKEKVTADRSFVVDGEVVYEVQYHYFNEQHMSYYVYDAMPESCEQGWSASAYCFLCGTYLGRTENNYDHSKYTVRYYDLSTYGMCGGYLEINSCACGEEKSWGFEQSKCNWSYRGRDENGTDTYYCDTCKTYSYRTEKGETDEQCNYVGTEQLKFVRQEQTVWEITVNESEIRHSERVVDVWLKTEGTSCEDGIYQKWQCRNCDYYYITEDDYHYQEQTDLIETECGTTLTREECNCGERASVFESINCSMETKSTQTGDNWKGTQTRTQTCKDCGLELVWQSSWEIPEGSCDGIREGTVTVNYDGQTYGLTYRNQYTAHRNAETKYSLKPGATTCEGNLVVTETCQTCDYTNTWNSGEGHRMNLVSTLELKDYGATCGGTLYRYQCPCEAIGRYEFKGDSLCKLQQQATELWITDAIHDESNIGTGGTQWLYSYAWTFTCAVTEPACDLKLRMAEYWLAEDCVATEYQTWQYYDASLNQWVTMDTVATGDTYSWHTYTEVEVDTTEGDAKVTGTRRTCACGAYRHDLRYEYADGTYMEKADAIDGKGVNSHTEWHTVNEYKCLYNNKAFVTKYRDEYTYRSGTSYWTHSEYTYDFSDNCKVTRVVTYPNSAPETYVSYHIYDFGTSTTVKNATCTQAGQVYWEENCEACNKVYNSGYNTIEPYNHSWFQNGEAGWKCYRCDLEDRNGASEGIILEDLTEELGNDVNYVAGYWNKDEVTYVMSVCAVVEGQEQPIYLDDVAITEHDTATAVCFSIAQAHAAADALVNGADYELQLNFVTTQGERIEYAITFTNAMAQ